MTTVHYVFDQRAARLDSPECQRTVALGPEGFSASGKFGGEPRQSHFELVSAHAERRMIEVPSAASTGRDVAGVTIRFRGPTKRGSGRLCRS